MIVAHITTDNRDAWRQYEATEPVFGTAPAALFSGLADRSDIELHLLSCTQKPLRSPDKLNDRVWFHSIHVPKIGWLRSGYAGCIMALRRRLSRILPDIVHGQGTERECAMGAVFSGFPNVVTIHGNMVRVRQFYKARIGSYHGITAMLETLALRRAMGVFCNSSYTENTVKGRAKRVWRVPNALQREFFTDLPCKNANKIPVLVNVGVIDPLKRQVELVELFHRLHAAGCQFEIRFAGRLGCNVAYNNRFKKLIAESLGWAVHCGDLETRQLRDWLDQADAMVHVSAEESFGLAVAEGLSRNLKMFTFGVGGTIDITADTDDTILLQPEDWSGLEAAISSWIESGATSTRNSAAQMRNRYHPDVIARRHIEIYQSVLGRSGNGFC